MERKTRIPTQKRALEKYEKIIAAAFKLFNEKGYYNITTVDIAKEADVATGSLYSYFNDKKDIYIEVTKRITNKIFEPTVDFWAQNREINFRDVETIKKIFHSFIEMMMANHNFSKIFHDDMAVLGILDNEIAAIRKQNYENQLERTRKIITSLSIPFKSKEASEVFIHYNNLLVEDVCHQVLFDKTIENTNLYIEQAVEMIYKLLLNLSDL
jgi:AcrR family transcriptional regulator